MFVSAGIKEASFSSLMCLPSKSKVTFITCYRWRSQLFIRNENDTSPQSPKNRTAEVALGRWRYVSPSYRYHRAPPTRIKAGSSCISSSHRYPFRQPSRYQPQLTSADSSILPMMRSTALTFALLYLAAATYAAPDKSKNENLPSFLNRQPALQCPHNCRPGRRGALVARRECRRRENCSVQPCVVVIDGRSRRGSWCAQRTLIRPVGTGPGIAGSSSRLVACRISSGGCGTSFVNQGFGCASIRFVNRGRACLFFINTRNCPGGAPMFVFSNALLSLQQVSGYSATFGRTRLTFRSPGISRLVLLYQPSFPPVTIGPPVISSWSAVINTHDDWSLILRLFE